MKIGILTFHRALNYGAFLQAFATLTFTKSLGLKAEIIDYWPEYHVNAYSLFNKKLVKKINFFAKAKYLFHFFLRLKKGLARKRKMENCQRLYLGIEKEVKFPTQDSLTCTSYDSIIYGSDQIWWKSNFIDYKGFDWAYWGDFIPPKTKKIAFSASMGIIDLSSNDKEEIKKHLNNFSNLAVREKRLQEELSLLTKKEIMLSVDPVFLLSKKEWESHLPQKKFSHKYVLLFNLMNSIEARHLAQIKAKELNCTVIEITPSVQIQKIGFHIKQALDPFEFLAYIRNAEFIVTSSFHGTAFSIIFEKQFYATGMKNNSGRVQTLLSCLNLGTRYVTTTSNISKEMIDYTAILNRKKQYIDASKKYLIDSLYSF